MGEADPDKNPRPPPRRERSQRQTPCQRDVIERAISKAMATDGGNYDEIRYEGYAPGGIAIIVETMTDNRNRTASSVRAIFGRSGGNLAETGGGFVHV